MRQMILRQVISGAVAALAVVAASAAPAKACGFATCEQTYVPTTGHSGCATDCNAGWGFERLAEPTTQYYYVNQGPTYTGPGAFAPYPTYQEGPSAYSYRWHRHDPRYTYHAMRYGHYYGHPVLRRYY